MQHYLFSEPMSINLYKFLSIKSNHMPKCLCEIPFDKRTYHTTHYVKFHHYITNNTINSTCIQCIHIFHLYNPLSSNIHIIRFHKFHTCHNYLSLLLPVYTFTYIYIYLMLILITMPYSYIMFMHCHITYPCNYMLPYILFNSIPFL